MDRAHSGALDVIVVTNGPGEVSGWVSPVCSSLARSESPVRVHIFLTPCPFATGREADVLRSLPGVIDVYRPRESVFFAFLGWPPRGFSPGRHGVLVHLGGDFWYSAKMAQRLGFPALAYSDRSATWVSRFSAFAAEDSRVRDKLISKGVAADKITVIGNLMVDGMAAAMQGAGAAGDVNPKAALGLRPGARCVLLLPGSRARIARHFIPFLLDVARTMAAVDRDTQFALALSPFMPRDAAESALGDAARELGLRLVDPGERFLAMAASDLAVSLPGSVTAELAFLGTPMIITVPLRHWEVVPLPGVFGMLGMIPGIGRLARYWGVKKATSKISYLALPNKRARKYIVPELVGRVEVRDVAIAALELLESPARLQAISRELREAMGDPGAADRLAGMIMSMAVYHRGDGGREGREDRGDGR